MSRRHPQTQYRLTALGRDPEQAHVLEALQAQIDAAAQQEPVPVYRAVCIDPRTGEVVRFVP